MELYELGTEYLKRSDILLDRIHDLNLLAGSLTDDDKIQLKRRITMLYTDAAECRRCAYILINYRRKEEQHDQKQI